MNLNDLPFNIFDLVLVGVLVAGIFSGRKRGMSEELLRVLQWLAVVVVCGLFYQPVAMWLNPWMPFCLLYSYMVVYACGAGLILALFAILRHTLGGKLIGSDIFGRGEYYLGMTAGFIRHGCILLVVLSLLGARYFTPAEVKAMERFQDDVYGSNFFPTWHTAQEVVFDKSLTGSWLRQNLGALLIKPTKPESREYHQQEWGAN